jgi:uncharacterized repeat protein (TIGR01451 family)
MHTLSEIFIPGTPALPEVLHALVVSPEREAEPGITLHATFTLRNDGEAAASAVRVRFNTPDCLELVPGSARCGDDALNGDTARSLLDCSGATLRDLAPGEMLVISIAFRLPETVEHGDLIELQAAVASREIPWLGSNVVRLRVCSRPQLRSGSVLAVNAAVRCAPGDELEVCSRINNSGSSSAFDVIVEMPIPDGTSYVTGSARIDDRELNHELAEALASSRAIVVTPRLAPGGAAELRYRVRIDADASSTIKVTACARVASRETPPFTLDPVHVQVETFKREKGNTTKPEFSASSSSIERRNDEMIVRAFNCGSAIAQNVRVLLDLPAEVRLESEDGTLLHGSSILLGEIQAGTHAEAATQIRLLGALPKEQLFVGATLWADGILPVVLESLVVSMSRPQFTACGAVIGGGNEDASSDGPSSLASGAIAGTLVSYSATWLERTLQFLEESRFDGLVTHLFALRCFLPTSLGAANVRVRETDALHEELARLFIKLRLPSFTIAPRDVEAESTRASIMAILGEATGLRGRPEGPRDTALTLRGSYDSTILASMVERMESAPLGSALPWAALARLLPDATRQGDHYKMLLIACLDGFDGADPEEFTDALQRQRDTLLDASLDILISSVRAAAVPIEVMS